MKRARKTDLDNPPVSAKLLSRMRPARDVLPDLVKAARGRPKLAFRKELISLRLDADILCHFRAHGEGWRTEINDALRKVTKLKRAG